MLKQLLLDIKDMIQFLEDGGYFNESQPVEKKVRACNTARVLEKGRKLTKKDVLEILSEDRMTYNEIAECYGISPSMVGHIKTGFSWWYVTGLPRRTSAQ